jgi:DNA polymerase/3'-5' exonuclease PolX
MLQTKAMLWAQKHKGKFGCQTTGTIAGCNHNKALTGIFEELAKIYSVLGDLWREYAYKKVVGVLQMWPEALDNADKLQCIPGVGESILEKVRDVLETGSLALLDSLKADPKTQVCHYYL